MDTHPSDRGQNVVARRPLGDASLDPAECEVNIDVVRIDTQRTEEGG
jgi:hypothetical protein